MSRLITCGICGKQFYKVYCSIYSLEFAGKVYNCCSYTCYQKAKKVKDTCNSSEYKRLRFQSKLDPDGGEKL